MEGVEFTCLRVGDVDTYSKNGDVKLIYGIPDILEKILGLEKKAATETKDGTCYYTADQIQTAMRNALADNVTTKNRLEDYVKAGEKMTLTDTTGKDNESRSGTWFVSACRDESTRGCYRYDRSVVCTTSDDGCRWRKLVL